MNTKIEVWRKKFRGLEDGLGDFHISIMSKLKNATQYAQSQNSVSTFLLLPQPPAEHSEERTRGKLVEMIRSVKAIIESNSKNFETL